MIPMTDHDIRAVFIILTVAVWGLIYWCLRLAERVRNLEKVVGHLMEGPY